MSSNLLVNTFIKGVALYGFVTLIGGNSGNSAQKLIHVLLWPPALVCSELALREMTNRIIPYSSRFLPLVPSHVISFGLSLAATMKVIQAVGAASSVPVPVQIGGILSLGALVFYGKKSFQG